MYVIILKHAFFQSEYLFECAKKVVFLHLKTFFFTDFTCLRGSLSKQSRIDNEDSCSSLKYINNCFDEHRYVFITFDHSRIITKRIFNYFLPQSSLLIYIIEIIFYFFCSSIGKKKFRYMKKENVIGGCYNFDSDTARSPSHNRVTEFPAGLCLTPLD